MANEWHGQYLTEEGIVADILKRVTADTVAVKRWLDPQSWRLPILASGKVDPDAPDHAGCLKFAGMSIRNFYGLWHADNPHTAKGTDEDLEMDCGVITDPRHPDNMSGRIIDAVKSELKRLFAEPVAA